MDESKPETAQPEEQRSQTASTGSGASDNEGFTLDELQRAYRRTLDAQRPPVPLSPRRRRDE
jgi:hypothetical protein